MIGMSRPAGTAYSAMRRRESEWAGLRAPLAPRAAEQRERLEAIAVRLRRDVAAVTG